MSPAASPPSPGFPPALRALMACLTPDESPFTAAVREARAAGVDLGHEAVIHGMLPALYRRLRDTAGESLLPAGALEALKTTHVRRLAAQAALLDMAADAIRLLQEADVPCLPLKGLALAATVGEAHLPRTMVDVDLLVPPARVVTASQVLQRAGWSDAHLPWALTPWEYRMPVLARRQLPIELHWRLWPQGPLLPFPLPGYADLAATAAPRTCAGAELLVPDVPSQMLIAAAAMTVDALAVQLRHWADLHWLRERLQAPDEIRLWALARAARMEPYLRIVLGLLEELWPTGRFAAATGPAADLIRRIAWRRLVHMPRETRRASSLLLLWRRLHGAGDQMDPAWREQLPPELRARAGTDMARSVLAGAGTGFVAGSKLLRRGALWLISPSERLALREEAALAEVLQQLAER